MRSTASKRRGNYLKTLKAFYLKAQALTVLYVPYSLDRGQVLRSGLRQRSTGGPVRDGGGSIGPVDPSSRARRLKFTVRRHKFNTDSLSSVP